MLNNLLYNSPLGLKVLYENFDMLISNDDKNYFFSSVVEISEWNLDVSNF